LKKGSRGELKLSQDFFLFFLNKFFFFFFKKGEQKTQKGHSGPKEKTFGRKKPKKKPGPIEKRGNGLGPRGRHRKSFAGAPATVLRARDGPIFHTPWGGLLLKKVWVQPGHRAQKHGRFLNSPARPRRASQAGGPCPPQPKAGKSPGGAVLGDGGCGFPEFHR